MKLYPALTMVALSILLVRPAWAATLLDDHFDDGDIATNTAGTGAGFLPFVQATGSISEAGGEAIFTLEGASLISLYSNDNLNLFASSGTTTTIKVGGGIDRK